MKKAVSSYSIIGLHILVWSVLLVVPTLFLAGERIMGLRHSYFLYSNIYHIFLFYLNAHLFYPRLFNRKYWWLYILVIAFLIWASYRAKLFFLRFDPSFQLTSANFGVLFFPPLVFFALSLIYALLLDRIRMEQKERELKTETLAAELKSLRSQISPHFLFNMLTSMVALARQKSDLLEPSLIRLSDQLRYMLYDSGKEKILLEEEINHIKDYVSLQQLRFGDDVTVNLEVINECSGCYIEPMLLIPFIENAFKHGIGMVSNAFINITLIAKENKLFFEVTNNYNPANQSKDHSSGIGLLNVKNRLELLYKGKYKLKIADENEIYSVQLKIDMS